ncbi:hypothetical protein A9Q96_00690 [Rhodobacterales bacterium 52_120_T64]|mgnify:CR=1 FL=1|nr:hypothetical protein A9Q96_00690 [Rhodobacterales bacterium 52_120_T64]
MVHIVLLRGINVGGHNKLPMAALKDILVGLGAGDVRIYIQSGNAVIQRDIAGSAISDAIERAKGFRPNVLVLPLAMFMQIAIENCFPTDYGKALHIWFLTDKPNFDAAKADALAIPSEKYFVTDHAIYLFAPDGIGRSKLAAAMEMIAGVPVTACNWNTVAKLLALAKP